MSEWISVKDRLPDRGGDYIVAFECVGVRKELYSSVSNFNISDKQWAMLHPICEYRSDDYLFTDYSMVVTHWQPLPEPPKD